jgi:hypothetical protein
MTRRSGFSGRNKPGVSFPAEARLGRLSSGFAGDLDDRPRSRLRRLLLPALALTVGAVIGFAGRSWLALPSDVVVDGHPSTLHVYRWDPVGPQPELGRGEAVIFKQATISMVVAELNRLPAFPKSGRSCDKSGVSEALGSNLYQDLTGMLTR